MFANTHTVVITFIACFLAVLFFLFVVIMFVDQIQCIMENTSTIDSLKKKNNKEVEDDRSEASYSKSSWDHICDVFGERLSWTWLFPTDIPKKLIVEREFD